MTSTQWTYRIPQERGRSIKCNLTRGTLNEQSTGKFIAYLKDLNPDHVHILVGCKEHGDWWDDLGAIIEAGFAECDTCGGPCYPVLPSGEYDINSKGFEE